MSTDMERHVQQTLDRLQCIKNHLQSPGGFQNAARELLEWCSDTRAFQRQFEQGLFGCLTVISQVAAQPGYDLDLGYRLLAVCAAHRDKFTPKSAGMLSMWCEDLGRLLLLRHQKTRTDIGGGKGGNMNNLQMPPGPPPQMQKNMQNLPPSDPMWQQTSQAQQPQQALSVVTTVWGVTPTTQTAPFSQNPSVPGFTNTTMSTTPYTQQQQGFPGNGMQKPGFNQNMAYRQPAPPYRNGYPPNPVQPGQHAASPPNGAPPPEALSAAALVAAAATATATATATAVMGIPDQGRPPQQQQHPSMNINMVNNHQQYGSHHQMVPHNQYNQYGPSGQQRPQTPMGMNSMNNMNNMNMGQGPPGSGMGQVPGPGMPGGGPGPMTGRNGGGGNMYGGQRTARMAPYPNPYMDGKRYGPMAGRQAPGYGPGQHPQYPSQGPPQYPGGKPGYPPAQQPLPSPGAYSLPHRPGTPYNTGQNPYNQGQMPTQAYNGPNRMAGPGGYNQMPGQMNTPMQQMQQGPMNPAMSQQMNPAMSQQMNPAMSQQMNPQHMSQQPYPNNMYNAQSPLPANPTPPMTPGSVPPYICSTNDVKPDIKPCLPMSKEESELRLTFPIRDGVMLPPFRLEHNLAVSNHVFQLRESVYQTLMWRSDLELQLKCFHHEDRQMNTNWPASVTVSVNAHPLVIERGMDKTSHKPLYLKRVCVTGRNTIQITVTSCCCSHLFVLQLVHRPSVRSVLQGLLRKRLLPAEHCVAKIKRNFTSAAASNPMNGDDVEQTAIKVSLKCPITYRCISLPARGHDCKHIQCFDLESYLQLNCERGTWRCPVCNKTALLEGLEIDQYIWGILHSLANTEYEEVTIDPTANWKPIPIKTMKEEDPNSCGNRWMSPSSMTMPTMSSWSNYDQPPTPQAGPPPSIGTPGPQMGQQPQQQQQPQQNHQQQGPPGHLQPGQGPRPLPPNTQGGPLTPHSNNGSSYPDIGSALSPSFPPSSTPDFLSSLAHLGDNITGSDIGTGENKRGGGGSNQPTGGSEPLNHPPRSNSSMLDGQVSQPLRHPTPGTPCGPPSVNPQTPQSMPPVCSSAGNAPNSSSAPVTASNNSGTTTTSTNNNNNNNTPSQSSNNGSSSAGDNNSINNQLSAAASTPAVCDNDIGSCTDLNFDPMAVIDGQGQGQEGLNLLPENCDPMDILSILGTSDGTSGNNNNSGSSVGNSDDLLSLFDS